MSIIVVIKEANTLLLSTDSRMMSGNHSKVDTDSAQKIWEIAPGTYIATSGRLLATEFQVDRARELVTELGTDDIQVIGAALATDSLPCLEVLVERLRMESDEQTKRHVSGESGLHACYLVGRSAGKLGYVLQNYQAKPDGSVACTTETYFGGERRVSLSSGAPVDLLMEIAQRFMQNPATWRDPMDQVSMRLLEAVKRSCSNVGGPWQVVRLNSSGARWISRPPRAVGPQAGKLTAATCSAAISFTSPNIAVTGAGGSFVINLDSSNGLKVTGAGVSTVLANVGTVNGVAGVTCTAISTGDVSAICGGIIFTIRATGQTSYLSGLSLNLNNGNVNIQANELKISQLPSSNPGAGRLWYDPSDGNRVKYTP